MVTLPTASTALSATFMVRVIGAVVVTCQAPWTSTVDVATVAPSSAIRIWSPAVPVPFKTSTGAPSPVRRAKLDSAGGTAVGVGIGVMVAEAVGTGVGGTATTAAGGASTFS